MTHSPDEIRVAMLPLGQAGGDATVEIFSPEATYSIDDSNPWLYIGFASPQGAKFVETLKEGVLERSNVKPLEGLTWWKWLPFADHVAKIGQHRRYGLYRTELQQPRRIAIRCYVWPARFFDARGYETMIDEIEREFGRAIEWERSDLSVRSRVAARQGRPTDPELLSAIRDELRAAYALERSGTLAELELVGSDRIEVASPESRMVAMWSWRRLADLVHMQREQRVASAAMGAATDRNQARARRRMERAKIARSEEAETGQLIAQVSRIAELRRDDLFTFDLSPAMQRDHRLRQLMRAFAPATREHWSASSRFELSTLPPLKAPDVFEMWGGARLIRALVKLGWVVRCRQVRAETPTTLGESHLVELTRDSLVLVVEHNPPVLRLDCGAAPPMHVRRIPVLEWACSNVDSPDGLIATDDLTPDYAIRLSSCEKGPLALAIGDATLSDPKYVGASESESKLSKAEKLIMYRERVGWRVGGRLIRCSAASTFIVLPGPSSRWEGMLVGVDSVLLLPDPGVTDDCDLAARVDGLLQAMLAAPSTHR